MGNENITHPDEVSMKESNYTKKQHPTVKQNFAAFKPRFSTLDTKIIIPTPNRIEKILMNRMS